MAISQRGRTTNSHTPPGASIASPAPLLSSTTEQVTAAEATELPAGTYRVIQTATAHMAFERGERQEAYRILRDNINHLLDSDHVDVTRMVAVEFITMLGALDRLPEAAAVLTYLDTTGDYGQLAREHLVADVVRRIEAAPDSQPRTRGAAGRA